MENNWLYQTPERVINWAFPDIVPHWVAEALQEKRLIFTLTTGRSGTAFLAAVLSVFPGVMSLHEPEPKFSHWMRHVQTQPEIAWYFWGLHKLPFIARQSASIYIETSHLFGKGFIEPLFHWQIPFDVIVLRRNRRDVARSLFQLNTIPARSRDGFIFLVSPLDPVMLPLPALQIMNDYQLCYWYTLEMEARAKYYAELVSRQGGKVVSIAFEDLIHEEGVLELANQLALPPLNKNQRKALREKLSQPRNTKKTMKGRSFDFSESELQQFEEEVLQLTGFEKEVPHA